jgi:hypothetical protein
MLKITDDHFGVSLVSCAQWYGRNAESGHEVGDLQDFFLACWRVMTAEQRAKAMNDPIISDILEGPEYEGLFPET